MTHKKLITKDEWARLVDLNNRFQFDYPSEFEWTKKDKEVLTSTLFELMWAYLEQRGHPDEDHS